MTLMWVYDIANDFDDFDDYEDITYKKVVNKFTLNEKKDYKISFDDKIWLVDLERDCSRRFIVFTEDGLKTVEIDYKIIKEPWKADVSTPYEDDKHIPRID